MGGMAGLQLMRKQHIHRLSQQLLTAVAKDGQGGIIYLHDFAGIVCGDNPLRRRLQQCPGSRLALSEFTLNLDTLLVQMSVSDSRGDLVGEALNYGLFPRTKGGRLFAP